MTTLREAAQQALQVLERAGEELRWQAIGQVQRDLRAALAKQVGETTLDVSGATCFSATPAKWPVQEESL